MYWTSGCGRIELTMTMKQAEGAHHQGSCDEDVAALARNPKIARQLAKIAPATLASVLREYGAWDAEQLADHDENLRRILWIAAGDIVEERRNGRMIGKCR